MAMAHPVPGLGKRKYLKHRQAASAPPDIVRLRAMLRPLDPQKVENIRDMGLLRRRRKIFPDVVLEKPDKHQFKQLMQSVEQSAKEAWKDELSKGTGSVTTYGGLHARKNLDEPTQGRVRPTSPTRQNKPHPPNVFLVTRLRHVDGCFDEKKAVDLQYEDAKRRVEKYVSKNERRICHAMGRSPPPPRPHTAHDRQMMQTVVGQVPAQAAEAWIKLSNDRDKASIRKAFYQAESEIKDRLEHTKVPVEKRQYRKVPPSLRHVPKPPGEVYATTRWLKKAGHTETTSVQKLLEALRNAPPKQLPLEGPHFHITDYSSMFSNVPKQPFYDFQIHPEWHQPWHKKYDNTINA